MADGDATVATASGREFAEGLGRAFAGALIFSLPILMTMEMWWLGFYMSPWRLLLLLAAFYPVLTGLSHFVGFDETGSIGQAAVHALVAYGVGFVCSAAMLGTLAILGPGMSAHEIAGKLALQTAPAALGALLAQAHFGSPPAEEQRRREASYPGQLFFLLIGALYVALTVASTEEMIQIAYKMSDVHALVAAALSLALLQAFLYGIGFKSHSVANTGGALSMFLRMTLVGYTVALAASAFLLWTFGRFEHLSAGAIAHSTIVLGLPAALGGAAARLTLDTQ